jgi:hypothetical protein
MTGAVASRADTWEDYRGCSYGGVVCPRRGDTHSSSGWSYVSTPEAATIMAAARTMYPHDALPDDVYAAREESGAARTIEGGVSAFNGGRPFAEHSADVQIGALKGIEGSDFFELVRSAAVVEVYFDQRTRDVVGYEGPSFDKGGYINWGFNDLDWLREPEEAS